MKHFNFFLKCCSALVFTIAHFITAIAQSSQFNTQIISVNSGLPTSTVGVLNQQKDRDAKIINTNLAVEPLRPVYLGAANRRINLGTGYFSVATGSKGEKVLVDPEGYMFYSLGVNQVLRNPSKTAQQQIDDLKNNYSINTLGNWTDDPSLRLMPYTFKFNLMLEYCYGGSIKGDSEDARRKNLYDKGILPLFEVDGETFEGYCTSRVSNLITPAIKTDPLLLGYFTDNELDLGGNYQSGSYTFLIDIWLSLSNYIDKGASDPNYIKALEWVNRRLGNPAPYNQAYNSSTTSPTIKKEFAGFIAETYYGICKGVLDSIDGNHLYLGSRIHKDLDNPELFKGVRKHVDIVTVNYYRKWNPEMPSLDIWSGVNSTDEKPVIITEFYAVQNDTTKWDNNGGAGWIVPSQAERAYFFVTFARGLLAHKNCVGFHWFKYADEPRGTIFNVEKNKDEYFKGKNCGLYQTEIQSKTLIIKDAWPELKSSFKKINQNIYNLRDWRLAIGSKIVDDSYIRPAVDATGTIHGSETSFYAKEHSSDTYRRRGLIQLQLDTNIISSTAITSANLKLYCKSLQNTATQITLSLYKVPTSYFWDQSTLTYDSAPALAKTVTLSSSDFVSSASITAANTDITLDVTNYIKALVLDNIRAASFVVVVKSSNDQVLAEFSSSEAASNKPRLEITYNGQLISATNEGLNILNFADNTSSSLSLFPNPVKNTLNLSCSANEQLSLQVYNLSGQLVKTIHTMSDKTSGTAQDVSFLNPGMYVLKVYGTISGSHQMKFIKE